MEGKKLGEKKIKQRIPNLSLSMKKRNFKEEINAINQRIKELYPELEAHEKKEKFVKMLKKDGKFINEQKKEMVGVKKAVRENQWTEKDFFLDWGWNGDDNKQDRIYKKLLIRIQKLAWKK